MSLIEMKMLKPKLMLLLLLLSFSTMLPALKRESIKYGAITTGFNSESNINVNIVFGKDYYRKNGVFAFGLENQFSFGTVNTDDLTTLNTSLMLGPVIGLRFNSAIYSFSHIWGLSPSLLLFNEMDNKNIDLYFSKAWYLKAQFDIDDDLYLNLSIFKAKPIPSQKTNYGIGIGLSWK